MTKTKSGCEMNARGMDEILNTLEMLAKGLDRDSSAYADVKLAAQAVVFAFSKLVMSEFAEFWKDNRLTERQREHLSAMGLEPNRQVK